MRADGGSRCVCACASGLTEAGARYAEAALQVDDLRLDGNSIENSAGGNADVDILLQPHGKSLLSLSECRCLGPAS